MGFKDVAFLPSSDNFPPHLLKIVVEVNALGPTHSFNLWLRIGNGMLPVIHIRSNKDSFCVN